MKLSKENIVNLEDFRVPNAKVFTGRDSGAQVRIKSKLDDIEQKYPQIKIIIPDNVYSINPSFFEELFINVVIKLGREGFLNKFSFESLGNYQYEKPLNEAIDRILRNKTALG